MSFSFSTYRGIVAVKLIDQINDVGSIRHILSIMDKHKKKDILFLNNLLRNVLYAETNSFSFKCKEIGYPDDLDKHCQIPYRVLNSLPGITTVDSCSGHGLQNFRMYFYCTNLTTLFFLKRCIENQQIKYGDWWIITVDTRDSLPANLETKEWLPEHPVLFTLRSKTIEMDIIEEFLNTLVDEIESLLNSFEFIEKYELRDFANDFMRVNVSSDHKVEKIIQSIVAEYNNTVNHE